MSDEISVPGTNSPTKGFEGFANKEAPTGKTIFHAKHRVRPAEGSAAEEATETPAFEKKEDAGK